MVAYRQNTPASKAIFQSSRLFNANGSWYFASREQAAHGPYKTEQQAKESLGHYLKNIRH